MPRRIPSCSYKNGQAGWRSGTLKARSSRGFVEACRQLREAGLWQWAAEAGGHGIAALAEIAEAEESNEA
ncbi:MAG: hypothetical protein HS126_03370 [Anaerolineales bacterium]|nr:hypothetical protein [Anaerolineales bacterium]